MARTLRAFARTRCKIHLVFFKSSFDKARIAPFPIESFPADRALEKGSGDCADREGRDPDCRC